MSDKIQPSHRERAAYVYVRQSTMHQVRHHLEGQRRQYDLADRARQLGFNEVVVIDDDLGRSGSGSEDRPGFAKLVAAVCEGRVGAVLALEASRLARNSRDWHHLIDLCAMTATVVIDHDGVYDPRLMNDRLLLGLKGTLSEFELGLLRQRAQEALRRMIARGEVLTEMPVGYVRTEGNRCEMTPDLQVQQAIGAVFAKFAELGSARQTLLWFRQERIALPYGRPATSGREVAWRLPIYSRILAVLKNPAYAGAFVYGRTEDRTVVREGRARKTRGHEVPRERWQVLINDHHPGYISWEHYQRNQIVLRANAAMKGVLKSGAAKTGPALLAGLLRCARCGRKLHVGYSGIGGRVPRYFCRGAHLNHGTSWCISFGGLAVDRAVVAQVLEAVRPAAVEAAMDAAREIAGHNSQKRRALELAVERCRYEAERARRQYDAAEPENRLVASELEKRWNETLTRLREAETRLDELDDPCEALSDQQRERLRDLGRDVEVVWEHPAAPVSLKKRILRTVLEEIVVDRSEDPPEVQMQLHWAGGAHTALRVARNRTGRHQHCTDREVIDLVRDLAKVSEDKTIAGLLNRLGYRTGRGNTWTETRIRSLRSYHEIAAFDPMVPRSWLTLQDAANELGVRAVLLKKLVVAGKVPGRQAIRGAPWMIERADLVRPEVKAAVEAWRRRRGRPSSHPGQQGISFPTTT